MRRVREKNASILHMSAHDGILDKDDSLGDVAPNSHKLLAADIMTAG